MFNPVFGPTITSVSGLSEIQILCHAYLLNMWHYINQVQLRFFVIRYRVADQGEVDSDSESDPTFDQKQQDRIRIRP